MTFQTFTGAEYLKIDIANNYGQRLGKQNWDKRLAWFDENQDNLDALVATAKSPALFYAGVQAWKKFQAGEPSGYAISLDGCSSGLQILSCLVGDRKAASLCNVVDTGNREDAYQSVFTTMQATAGSAVSIAPDDVKQAVMTSLYGSEQVPRDVFGSVEGLFETFIQTMTDMAPGVWELNTAFLGMWNPEALSYNWVLPDNFHVHTKVKGAIKEEVLYDGNIFEIAQYKNIPQKTGRSIGANVTHSIDSYIVRELCRRAMHDPEQIMQVKVALCTGEGGVPDMSDENTQMVAKLWAHYRSTGMLSARILDHLTEDSVHAIDDRGAVFRLIYSLPKKPFQVMTIHDCFRVLPNYGNDVRRLYNQLLSEIAQGDLLSAIVSSVLGRKVGIGKLDSDMWKDVVDTNYALS